MVGDRQGLGREGGVTHDSQSAFRHHRPQATCGFERQVTMGDGT